MSFAMQGFLNVEAELASESALPAELPQRLAAAGFPPVRSAQKLAGASGGAEVFVLQFATAVPAELAPSARTQVDRTSAVLHVLGAQLPATCIFSSSAPASSALVRKALALAAAAGAPSVPRVWLEGELARRGALRRVPYVLLERVAAAHQPAPAGGSPSLALPDPAGADTLGLPRYDEYGDLFRELRGLLETCGSAELVTPLARLETACATTVPVASAAAPTLNFAEGGASAAEGAPAGGSQLDSFAAWGTAWVGDGRLASADGAPWDELRAFCAVVKARWIADLLRRDPGAAPRCELPAVLRAHDAGQALLAKREWLPAAIVAPGSSSARMAETFLEELCPHY